MLDIKQVKPKGKQSDKYSIQLYRYLNRKELKCDQVYYQSMHPVQIGCDENHEPITEYREGPFDINNFDLCDIFLSYQPACYVEERDEISGTNLQTILGSRKDKYELYCYVCGLSPRKYLDISEVFWNEYIKRGRCIWDRKHNRCLQDDEDRFTYVGNNSRRCNWCGEWQHREIHKNVKIERKEIWI